MNSFLQQRSGVECVIRIAMASDVGQLTSCIERYRKDINAPSLPPAQITMFLGSLFISPSMRLVVAVRDHTIIGFVIVGLSFSTSRLSRAVYCSDLWVADEDRKQGVGSTLIDFVKSYAGSEGAPFLYGLVDVNKTSVLHFHEACGWKITPLAFMYIDQPDLANL